MLIRWFLKHWWSLLPAPVWPLPIDLIHGPNMSDSYAILLFTASDFTSITSHIHSWCCFCFGSVSSYFLELLFHWSPGAYWAPTDTLSTYSSSFSVLSFFAISWCSWVSQGKNTEVACHSLLQWTTFCQNSPLWSIHLWWPFRVWLIVALS